MLSFFYRSFCFSLLLLLFFCVFSSGFEGEELRGERSRRRRRWSRSRISRNAAARSQFVVSFSFEVPAERRGERLALEFFGELFCPELVHREGGRVVVVDFLVAFGGGVAF